MKAASGLLLDGLIAAKAVRMVREKVKIAPLLFVGPLPRRTRPDAPSLRAVHTASLLGRPYSGRPARVVRP